MGISVYIIFFKNTPTTHPSINLLIQDGKLVSAVGALHVTSGAPILEPNKLSNTYNIYSPLGRGYGAWSSGQLIQIDCIKTELGGKFDATKVVDSNGMLDPIKIKQYAKANNISPWTISDKIFIPK